MAEKECRIVLRTKPGDKSRYKKVAHANNKTLSDLVRDLLNKEERRLIKRGKI